MAYTLQAVIAKTGSYVNPLPEHLRIVSLPGGVDMIPLGEEARGFYGIEDVPLTGDDVEYLEGVAVPDSLIRLCETLSQRGVVAYIEAAYFGGVGNQAHVMFANGKQAGPLVRGEWPINKALRALGVQKGDAFDEFVAVGLGRHRDSDEWLAVDDEPAGRMR